MLAERRAAARRGQNQAPVPALASTAAASRASKTTRAANALSTNALPTCLIRPPRDPARHVHDLDDVDRSHGRTCCGLTRPRPARTSAGKLEALPLRECRLETGVVDRTPGAFLQLGAASPARAASSRLVGHPDDEVRPQPPGRGPLSRTRVHAVSGSSVVPLGPTRCPCPSTADTAVEARRPAAVLNCPRPASASCQSCHSQSRSSPESRWSQGSTSLSVALAGGEPVEVDALRPSTSAALRPSAVGEVLAPAVEPAAVAPHLQDHRADPAVAAGEQPSMSDGWPSW